MFDNQSLGSVMLGGGSEHTDGKCFRLILNLNLLHMCGVVKNLRPCDIKVDQKLIDINRTIQRRIKATFILQKLVVWMVL